MSELSIGMIESSSAAGAPAPFNLLFRGVVLSVGLAAGRACVYRDILDSDFGAAPVGETAVGNELVRLQQAMTKVFEDLAESAEIIGEKTGGDIGGILEAHEMILSDPGLQQELETRLIQEAARAEAVVHSVFRKRHQRFLKLPNPILRQRADDVMDLARRILRKLAGFKEHTLERFPADAVLVARQLYVSEMVYLARRRPRAIVTEIGSPTSHVAILAQAMSIPAVAQVKGLVENVKDGGLLAVDALRGTIVLNPDAETNAEFQRQCDVFRRRIKGARKRAKETARTRDGKEIPVMANVNLQGDADRAADNGADGVGLYRLEGLYLERGSLPSEDELVAEIGATIAPFAGRIVCLRLLDIGGDKLLPYLDLPAETNPSLGRRGIRLLFDHPQLLQTQLRAFLRLSREHDVRILAPMITTSEDMRKVRAQLEEEAAELGVKEIPMVGAMIETPAAALCVSEITQYADFLSIGTNDLTQYVMAADRDSPFVAGYLRDDHPAVFRLIRMITAESGGKLVAVCGRLAGKEKAVPLLIEAGVGLLSVAAPLIPIIKDVIRNARASSPGNEVQRE